MSVEVIHAEALDALPRFAGQAALVYADPLFNTGQTFRTKSGEVAFEAPSASRARRSSQATRCAWSPRWTRMSTTSPRTSAPAAKVVYLNYDCGCGQRYPADPMIGVDLGGIVEEFWPEELAGGGQ